MEEPVYIKNMRELRKKAHYTQEEVSQKLNIQRQTYSNYENEWRQPPLDIIIRLAELYQVSTDYLLLGSEPDDDASVTSMQAPLRPDGNSKVTPAQTPLYPEGDSKVTPAQVPLYPEGDSKITSAQAAPFLDSDTKQADIKNANAKENTAHSADAATVTEHVFRTDITDISTMQEQDSDTIPITCSAPGSNQADCLHPSAAVHRLLKEFYSLSEEEQTEAWLLIQTQEPASPDWIIP